MRGSGRGGFALIPWDGFAEVVVQSFRYRHPRRELLRIQSHSPALHRRVSTPGREGVAVVVVARRVSSWFCFS